MVNLVTSKFSAVLRTPGTKFFAADASSYVELDEAEDIRWVASTWIDPNMLYIFACISPVCQPEYLITYHSDGGFFAGWTGPWGSLIEAKQSVGEAPEGWTDTT